MKWCRFQSGQRVAYGVVESATVIEVTFYAAGVNYREHMTEMAKNEVEIPAIGVLRNPVRRER